MARLLFAGFGITLTIWVLGSTLVVINRLLFDRRERRLLDVALALADPAIASLPPLDRSPAIRQVLAPLTRRATYGLIASAQSPAWLIETCAMYALEQWGLPRIVLDASGTRRRHKWRRISALFAIGHLRPDDAYRLLEAAICDLDPDVSAAAATVLHRIGDHRAAVIMVSALRHATVHPSRIATHIDQFPIPVHDILCPLLADPRPETRYWAASLLYRYPDVPDLALQLAPLAVDPSPTVRKAALASLGSMKTAAALPIAQRALTDPVGYVRSTAVRVIGHHAAVDPDDSRRRTMATWIAPLIADPVWEVRLAVKEHLVQMGPGVWREVAIQLKSSDEFARNGAAEVLQNLGVLDWALLFADNGVILGPELSDALAGAFREGGSRMADAASDRSLSDALPAVETLFTGLRFVGARS